MRCWLYHESFRSGQDNQEPIYDYSRVKIGADIGDPGTVTMEDIEGGGGGGSRKKPRFYGRLQRHIDTATAIAGDVPQWITAFLDRIEHMFNDMVFNFTLNSYLDGQSVYKAQKKYIGKEVGLFI